MHLRPLLAALLGLCLVPASALAQPSDAVRATARELGQEGHVALDQHDFATAADRFARADVLVHAPTFVLGVARAKLGLGKLASAYEAYTRIVREGAPPRAPAAFFRAIEDARKELAALAPRIPHVIVQVTGAAAPKVSLDGAELPAAALGVERAVDPGKHTLVASVGGLAAKEVAFTIAEGKTETVTLDLEPRALESPLRATPQPPASPPPPESLPPEPSSAGSTRRALGIAGLAAGGAGFGLGAIMGGLAIAKHGDLAKSCPNGACPLSQQGTLGPQVDTYHAYSTVSTVGFVVGGALATAGVVVLVTAPKPAAAGGGATVGPVIGVGWAGAEGRF